MKWLMVLVMCSVAWGQAPDLTTNEKLAILKAQNAILRAQDALQKTPQYQQYMTAQAELQKVANEAYASRKIKFEDWTLCDGPGVGVCADVPAGEIAFRATKKEEVKK